MFKKFAAAAAATAMALTPVAATAGTASKLSLSNTRATTTAKKNSDLVASPLFIILGIVAVVGVLEITGAINIFDDSPDSP